MKHTYLEIDIPADKKRSGPIGFISDLTGTYADLDPDIHKGFTIRNGKRLYWYIIWHKSGHCTVYPTELNSSGVYIKGDTIITVHFK